MAGKRYPVPAAETRAEIMVANSRFIATLAPVFSVEDARAFIARVRAEFADATHNVPVFLVGYGASVTAHSSDDGEPSGTAGRPALAVLQGSGLGDAAVVVTRYFGGTLLGKGGLVRAYTSGVTTALATLPTKLRVEMARVAVEVEYAHVDALRRALPAWEASVLGEEYASTVGYRIELPAERVGVFEAALRDLTAGDVLFEVTPGR